MIHHVVLGVFLVACGCRAQDPSGSAEAPASPRPSKPQPSVEGTSAALPPEKGLAVATFAGGCFWCVEPPFEHLEGVEAVMSGYTGGDERAPTYEEVSSGQTTHAEAVRVLYDPDVTSYEALLDVFWRNIDPTAVDRQFVDEGRQYRSAIFVHDEAQRVAAEASKRALVASGRFAAPIVTSIEPAGTFWVAEDYHQDFHRTHPDRYRQYRRGSGRDAFIEAHWGTRDGDTLAGSRHRDPSEMDR